MVYAYYDGPNREVYDRVNLLLEGELPDHEDLGDRVRMLRMPENYDTDTMGAVFDFLITGERGIFVIDTVDRAGGGKYVSEDYLKWHGKYVKPYRNAGWAVVLVDHEPKPQDDKPPSQIGTVAKRNTTRLQFRLHRHPHKGIVLEKTKDNNNVVPESMFYYKLVRVEDGLKVSLRSANEKAEEKVTCLLYTSPSPRDS